MRAPADQGVERDRFEIDFFARRNNPAGQHGVHYYVNRVSEVSLHLILTLSAPSGLSAAATENIRLHPYRRFRLCLEMAGVTLAKPCDKLENQAAADCVSSPEFCLSRDFKSFCNAPSQSSYPAGRRRP